MEMLYEENKPSDAEAAAAAAATKKAAAAAAAVPPPNTKPCRYGQGCNRPDCKFWHPADQEGAVNKEDVDVGDKLAKLNLSWVPMTITINRHENGKVSYGQQLGELEGVAIEESKTYDL